MEARAVNEVFGGRTLCSSTKSMTGHMLGAAGANEAAFLWLMLEPDFATGMVPPHVWDGEIDPAIPPLNLAPMRVAHRTSSTRRGVEQFIRFRRQQCGRGTWTRMVMLRECPYSIEELLIHRPPMLLLDKVVGYDEARNRG